VWQPHPQDAARRISRKPPRCDARSSQPHSEGVVTNHVSPQALEQHRGPHGPLEREPLEDSVFGWLAFVVAAFVIGRQVGTKNLKDEDYSTGQSHKADLILKKGFPQSDRRPSSCSCRARSCR
jgi:hypothetical protein